jgi:hypothetical protein
VSPAFPRISSHCSLLTALSLLSHVSLTFRSLCHLSRTPVLPLVHLLARSSSPGSAQLCIHLSTAPYGAHWSCLAVVWKPFPPFSVKLVHPLPSSCHFFPRCAALSSDRRRLRYLFTVSQTSRPVCESSLSLCPILRGTNSFFWFYCLAGRCLVICSTTAHYVPPTAADDVYLFAHRYVSVAKGSVT